jgi:hypothetical protein
LPVRALYDAPRPPDDVRAEDVILGQVIDEALNVGGFVGFSTGCTLWRGIPCAPLICLSVIFTILIKTSIRRYQTDR